MSNVERIKVAVQHADPIARAGLSFACASEPDIEVQQTPDGNTDVVVADYSSAMSVAAESKVLIVGGSDREWDVRRALQRGVRGYLVAGCTLGEIAEGVRAVHRGARHLSARAADRLAESIYREPLTAREEDVLRLASRGLPNKSIATRLGIATGTVKSHLKSCFEKLNVRNRTQAAALLEQQGLLEQAA
jgi:DNA-binding NarL/FixJ family response regulator